MKKSTTELFTELKESRNIAGYLSRNQEEFMVPLHEYLTNLLTEKLNILYPRNQWDSVIISAIEQQLNVIETNHLLEQLGEELTLD